MKRTERDKQRRAAIERQEQLRDREEDFDAAKAISTDSAERQRLMDEFAAFRQLHRLEDARLGKRTSESGIAARTIWWLPWIHIAVESELRARDAWPGTLAGDPEALVKDLRASLVATAAAASTIEAVVEDIRFFIPQQKKADSTAEENLRIITTAFGRTDPNVSAELEWLFETRNSGVHPYSELTPTDLHPSGTRTSSEHSIFNAVECSKAVDIAMHILAIAENPPNATGRWVVRWVKEHRSGHIQVEELRRRRTESPLARP